MGYCNLPRTFGIVLGGLFERDTPKQSDRLCAKPKCTLPLGLKLGSHCVVSDLFPVWMALPGIGQCRSTTQKDSECVAAFYDIHFQDATGGLLSKEVFAQA